MDESCVDRIICTKEATREDFSIVWSPTTCVPSKVTLEETKVDLSLLDNVKIPYMWSKYIYHVGSSLDLYSFIHSDSITGGKETKEGRQNRRSSYD